MQIGILTVIGLIGGKMRKNKKSKTNLYDRLKVLNDYLCDKEPTLWDCRGCDYFYVEPDYRIGRCLRYSIRDWILYHMEENNE